jgi:phage FluMu protein Com
MPESRESYSAKGLTLASFPISMFARKTFLILALVFLASAARAQISPGPLARPHKDLEGATHCTDCHQLAGGKATFKCLECHTEIAERLTAHKGLHFSYGLPPGSSQGCAKCHSDHNGVDFPIVKWDTKTFDHKQTGYLLEGKHEGVECKKCHTPEHISAAMRPLIKTKDLNRTFIGVPETCATCHKDFHQGRLGPKCETCHNFNEWKNVAKTFDHSKTRYPLTGEHQPVKCQRCHTPGPDGNPRYQGIPFSKCDDCHKDPHHGEFKQSCATCHTTSGWKRVTQGLKENFDHSKTKYPLVGKHQTVECVACHANSDFKKELLFAKCTDCHKDAHNGQFLKRPDKGECSACHNLDGWKPSTFDVKAHATSKYPLEGKHAKVECKGCHIPKGKDTLYTVKFARCLDCHKDEHQTQFAAAPWMNLCEKCHTLGGFKPSTFSLAKHKETRFPLTGGHEAVLCSDCHKPASAFPSVALLPASVAVQTEPPSTEPGPGYHTTAVYHFQDMSCTTCHKDPHNGQFDERMKALRADGTRIGCEACHTTKNWRDLTRFDHDRTKFALLGAHRAVACIDCHKPPNLGTKLVEADFTQASTKCEDCHEDAHGRQFAKAEGITPCADCHNSAKWKPALFDHETRTQFSLKGGHQNVRCADCHKLFRDVDGKQVLFYKPCPKDCKDCHGPDPKFEKKT